MHTPEKTASYEALVAAAAYSAMRGRPLLLGPVDVVMNIMVLPPLSWSAKKRSAALDGDLWPTTKPDIDNVVKGIFDALNGVVWGDDRQVCGMVVLKNYGAVPGVAVTVEEV